jgi:hypothetical protein
MTTVIFVFASTYVSTCDLEDQKYIFEHPIFHFGKWTVCLLCLEHDCDSRKLLQDSESFHFSILCVCGGGEWEALTVWKGIKNAWQV